MNLRLGAVPRVSQRMGSGTISSCQSAHATAMMLLGADVDGMEPAPGYPSWPLWVDGTGPKRRRPFEDTLTLSYVCPWKLKLKPSGTSLSGMNMSSSTG